MRRESIPMTVLAVLAACSPPTADPPDAPGGGGADAPADAPSPTDAGDVAHLGSCTPLSTETCSADGWCSSRPFFVSVYGAYAAAEDDVWVAGQSRAHFDGTQVCTLDRWWGDEFASGVGGSGSDDVWIVAGDGLIVHWNGTEAAPVMGPDPTNGVRWRAVWAASSTDAWAVGERTIGHWDGSTWTLTDMPASARGNLEDIDGVDATHVWAVTADVDGVGAPECDLLTWDGASWTVTPGDGRIAFEAIHAVSATEVYAIGVDTAASPAVGIVWRGPTWAEVPPGTWTVSLNGAVVDPDGVLRVYGQNATMVRRDAGTWIDEVTGLESPTDPLLGPALYDADVGGRTLYVAAKDGYFFRRAL